MVVFAIGSLVMGPWMLRKLVAFAQAALAHAASLT